MTPEAREARLQAAVRDGVEIVILGGGVNGAGLFRDLCLQGVPCLLVDRGDWASGTSAAPSRLIHGGIKYLETGELGLVAQSTLERNLLLRNAPHLVEPLPTVIPIFSWTKGIGAALRTLFGSTTAPRARGALLIEVGLWLYDLYGTRARVMPRHRFWSRSRALREFPALTPSIVAAGTYWDARITQPERLVMELVEDGLAACQGSAAVTYAILVSADGGELRFKRGEGAPFAVRPLIVANAAGPWIDAVNATLGVGGRLIGGTRGSHVVLDHPELVRQLNGRMIYFEADGGRICLVFDYLGKALAGSTDIPDRDPDRVRATDEEVAYILQSLRALFPALAIGPEQVVHVYSGIRPLPASGASNPGLISRDHSAPVAEPAPGRPFAVVSLVGGKWTTFRGFAEEVADAVLGRLGRARRLPTRDEAIGGGHGFPTGEARADWIADTVHSTGLDPARIGELLARYGTTARAVAAHRGRWMDADRLPDSRSYSRAEIDWIVREEGAMHLADVVMRRTSLAVTGSLTARDLDAVAEVTALALGWAETRTRAEIEAVRARLEGAHRMRLAGAV
ncbi:Glycerol-3-phosphate dehydrogenase [Rubellimicrobium mesophilum DSM 19309]|uniref:Glycerol-3-phosphate dehydrogenase n=1 Tax=Rubellimicrobium mesophilum DSM 19309 TaxID=442562 RepID=A0A017HT83_9RHOB|nr:glycerol-3-phosphate dehydrogenase/oxidase [Rubellimicrobium mesophilum]EYD77525.1 Glycerol-3-phosphate dehydrogenase [Rubellimicrobium mesophilum DSM 19309]